MYQGILSLNLSAGTRSTIEDFGFFFEPQKAAVSAGRIVRNAYFAWFGRVVFNLLTNPATTMQELAQLRLLEIAWLKIFLEITLKLQTLSQATVKKIMKQFFKIV